MRVEEHLENNVQLHALTLLKFLDLSLRSRSGRFIEPGKKRTQNLLFPPLTRVSELFQTAANFRLHKMQMCHRRVLRQDVLVALMCI